MKHLPLFLFLLIPSLAQPQSAADRKPSPASSDKPTDLPEVLVTERRLPDGALLNADTSEPTARATDGADLLKNTPGAAVLRNGPQTGIVQLRGLSGDRVKVAVDGMTITPACPNHMDPPLHYASPGSVDSIAVMAGITPVSQGGDSIAGTVVARRPEPRFADEGKTLVFGETGAFFRSSNDGYGFDLESGVATSSVSLSYDGSWQRANDLRFPHGQVRATGFGTHQHGILAAIQTSMGVFSLDAGMLRTRDAGTPALPMDMVEDDGFNIGLRYRGELDFGTLEGRVYHHSIDHLMDNYSLRTPGPMRMQAPASSNDYGAALSLSMPRGRHTVRLGTDFHHNAFDAYQRNVVNGMQQDIINKATRTRFGAYAELETQWSELWLTQFGVRNDTVFSDAGGVGQFMPPAAADAAAFNARDHSFTDVNLDLTASLRFEPNDWSAYELGFARKNRAPSLIERYLWTPLAANAGLADGRTYTGNLDLESEHSHQISLTADFHGSNWQFRTSPFYNFVHNYIQGVPIARLDTAGRPVLQFQNLGRADLYGVDTSFRYAFSEALGIRGDLSYVRGINRDNNDNLYRIAPLHGSFSVDGVLGGWKNTLELVFAAGQNETAAFNGEPATSAYSVLNFRTGKRFDNGFGLELGVENLTDEFYADHLSGLNRVAGSDVAVGQRVPNAGRFLYVQVNYRF